MANYKPPDLRNRSPKVEILPDMRLRITRVYDLLNEPTKKETASGNQPGLSAYRLPWGTADFAYADCLLVKQDFTGQYDENGNNPEDPVKKPPTLTRIYEEIDRTAETSVGEAEIDIDQDGLYTIIENYIQYSVAAGGGQTFETVGSSAVSSPHAAVLKLEERTDDGTLQRIKRTYISSGLISQTIDTKYNGALTMTTLVTVNVVPTTPAGATLVDAKVDHPNGLPVYTYTYALGSGQISELIEYRLSPDQGATGVTVYTIKFLSAPLASNPISPPGGTEEISILEEQQDGYILWTGVYATGQGIIATEVEIKNDGKLFITTITSINTAPSAPSARISGTVTLIKTDVRNGTRFEDGTIIYTYTWAEGNGEISIDIDYMDSVDQGTNGVTRTTIRWLVAPAGAVQPTSLSGSVNIKQSYEDVEGYRIWTTVWGKGAGLILDEKVVSKINALIIYHRIGLDTAPTAPSPTISGTLNLIESGTRNAEGYQIFDYKWAEGNNQASIITRGQQDFSIQFTVTDFASSAPGSPPANPGSGTAYCVEWEVENLAGYYLNRAVWHQIPPSTAFRKQMSFEMPGQIEITSPDAGFNFVPPVRQEILATVTVDYATSQITTTPFTVKAYAGLDYAYVVAANGQSITGQKGTGGYLSGATGNSGANSLFNGIMCSSWSYTITGSTPSAPPSGATTIGVDNEPYLIDIAGTVIFKRKVTTYSF